MRMLVESWLVMVMMINLSYALSLDIFSIEIASAFQHR